MKILWLGLLAGLVVLGCTHSDVQPNPGKENVYYLKPGEREPAQAYDLVWHPAVFTLNVTRSSESFNASGKITQEMVWKETVTEYENKWVEKEREVPGICSRAMCPQASGQSELWTAYFNAPKEKKADALAKAIEGIGDISAKALVEKGYFRTKPRSWEEFANEIDRAAGAGVIRKNVATMVVENHQAENINKLGYKMEACTIQKYSCDKTITERVLQRIPHPKTVEKRRIVQQRPVDATIKVNGAKLLSWEKDQLMIVIDEEGHASIDGSGFNRYQITKQSGFANNIYLDITADGRVLRDLPGNVVLRDSYEVIGGKATFSVELDPKYMVEAQNDPNAQFVIDYQVNVCEYGWSGTCGFSSWKKISATTAVLTSPRTTVTVDVPVKNKSYIAYRVSRQSSDFFNSKPTYERSTESIKMPKY